MQQFSHFLCEPSSFAYFAGSLCAWRSKAFNRKERKRRARNVRKENLCCNPEGVRVYARAPKSFQIALQDVLYVGLGGDWETASVAKGLCRNLDSWRCLLALVLVALDHTNYALHQFEIKIVFAGNLLSRVRLLHIVLKNSIEHFVVGQAVAVLLIKAQFR